MKKWCIGVWYFKCKKQKARKAPEFLDQERNKMRAPGELKQTGLICAKCTPKYCQVGRYVGRYVGGISIRS